MTAPAPATPARRSAANRPADLRVVDPNARPRRAAPIVAACLIVMFVALFGNAVFHSVLVSNQERLDGLEQRVAEREARQSRLRLEAARLAAPPRIVEAAERRGLHQPDQTTWLMPRDSDHDRPASGASPPTDERASGR